MEKEKGGGGGCTKKKALVRETERSKGGNTMSGLASEPFAKSYCCYTTGCVPSYLTVNTSVQEKTTDCNQ